MQHPYKKAPNIAFWKSAVSTGFSPSDLCWGAPLIRAGQQIGSAGSCFAANIIPYLEKAGLAYVKTETPNSNFGRTHKESLSYPLFSAAYGNIYTARHLLQLIQRAIGEFHPKEDRWYQDGYVIDPFRPGLTFPAASDFEFDLLTKQHLSCVLEAFKLMDVFVFTLGLTEAWTSSLDGAVFPVCPGTIAGDFDPQKHTFKNFSASEVASDLRSAFKLIREINPEIKFILTVSPVPLVATATADHILQATIYSKSVLRVAAQEIVDELPYARYFPAYEIVTGPQAPYDFFDETRRDVTAAAVAAVMGALLSCCESTVEYSSVLVHEKASEMLTKKSKLEGTAGDVNDGLSEMSKAIARIECEEAAAGL